MTTVRLVAAAVSDIGGHRDRNQDAAFTAPWAAAVADGVGGGPAGDHASAAIVHRLAAASRGATTASVLRERVLTANWDLAAHARSDPARTGMATTLTGLWLARSGAVLLAHTGDSRGYRLRHGALERRTRDDSLVQALVDGGVVAPEDAASHPRRNVITASLSGAPGDAVRVEEHDAQPGDRWLLCSDGVTDYVPEAELLPLVTGIVDPHAAAAAVVDLALRAGTRDNATAVIVDIRPADGLGRGVTDSLGAVQYAGAAGNMFREDLDERSGA